MQRPLEELGCCAAAYHEAGHAVAYECLAEGEPSWVSVRIFLTPFGWGGGTRPAARGALSSRNEAIMNMAGFAAEAILARLSGDDLPEQMLINWLPGQQDSIDALYCYHSEGRISGDDISDAIAGLQESPPAVSRGVREQLLQDISTALELLHRNRDRLECLAVFFVQKCQQAWAQEPRDNFEICIAKTEINEAGS